MYNYGNHYIVVMFKSSYCQDNGKYKLQYNFGENWIFGGVMRITDIISMAKLYLVLGLEVALFLGAAFLIGYHVIYKKICKGTKKVSIKRLLLYAIFTCYVVIVLGATMLNRGSVWHGSIQLHLFYSYREAWNSFSPTEWRNIVLNILMFVPFGFLLPFVSEHFKTFWKTYLAGFGFTLVIETLQLILEKGIFEVDDLFNNLLGAIIGYGCYRIFIFVYSFVQKKREKFLPVICYQIPLVLTVGTFVTIFFLYEKQEIGNLSSNYVYKLNNVAVNSDIEYSTNEDKVAVYQLHVADENETREQAERIFALFDSGIDDKRTDIYENTAIYYSDDENSKSLWIEYAGNIYRYTDFNELYGDNPPGPDVNASEEEIRNALEAMSVYIPEGVIFKNVGDGKYTFTAEQIFDGDKLYNGSITCNYTKNKTFSELSYSIIAFEEYKTFPIISEKKAFEQVQNGKFKYPHSGEIIVSVNDVNLEYEVDSKGFYQPVYVFDVNINDFDTAISVSAIK